MTTSASAAAAAATQALKITARRSAARGNADHGWLQSYHTFSFANYQSREFDGFGPLRVINEDRVLPGEGFGKHSHREFEIFSYVVAGALHHEDSLGGSETLVPGDIQMTSTGTGISHSEYNRDSKDQVHFLQIWAIPSESKLQPGYYRRHFPRESKLNKLVTVVDRVNREGVIDEREAAGPAPVHSKLKMLATVLEPKKSVTHKLASTTTRAYLHLIMTSGYRKPTVSASDKYPDGGAMIEVNEGLVCEEGDGAFIEVRPGSDEDQRVLTFKNVAEKDAEFVLFEME